MKFRRLEIENFGVFQSRTIELPAEPPASGNDFHLVYGENEAGKSTLLQWMRELLFGFSHANPYVFDDHAGRMAGAATVELADGRTVHFRRQKLRKDPVAGHIEPGGQTIDEEGLRRLLGGANETLYRNVFAFSLDELASGEESLKSADLDEALFGAALGGLKNFRQVRASLLDQQQALFSPRGQKPTINQLIKTIKQQHKSLREAHVKPADYERLDSMALQRSEQEKELSERVATLRSRHGRQTRLEKALPSLLRLEAIGQELTELQAPALLQAEQIAEHRALVQQIESLDAELADLQEQQRQNEADIAALPQDEPLLEHEPQIHTLQRQLGMIEAYRRDIPQRRSEAETSLHGIRTRLAELHAEWRLDDLHAFQVGLAQREEVDRLAEEQDDLRGRQKELASQRRRLQNDIEHAEQVLDEAPDQKDALRFKALAEQAGEQHNLAQQFSRQRADLAALAGDIEALESQLCGLIDRAIDDFAQLPVPLAPAIIQHASRLDEAAQQVAAALQQLNTEQTACREKEQELAQTDDAASVERGDIEKLRQERDAAWSLIRRKYVEQKNVDDAIAKILGADQRPLPSAYEELIAKADRLADRRFDLAEVAVRREHLQSDLRRSRENEQAAAERLSAARQSQSAADDAWRELWRRCGFTPLSPAEMQEWLRQYHELLKLHEKRRAASACLAETERQIAAFRTELHKVFPDSDESVEVLLKLAEQRVDQARYAAARQEEAEQSLRSKKDQLRDTDAEAAEIDSQSRQWNDRWQRLLEQLQFPREWSVRAAAKILNTLAELRQENQQVESLQQRVADMEIETKDFEQQVEALCRAAAADLVEAPAEGAVEQLARRVGQTRKERQERLALQKQLELDGRRIAEKTKRREQLLNNIAKLRAQAEVENDAQFAEVARNVQHAAKLRGEIRELEREFRTLRAQDAEREFLAALHGADPETLRSGREQLESELRKAEAEHKRVVEQAALARKELDDMQGASRSLDLNVELEGSRSRLQSAVDRWAPLVVAHHLLSKAIDSFEKENQPQLLRDAGRLFRKMTGDKYRALRPRLEDKGVLLIEAADGRTKTPAQLSTGAREQLYLALRLAYVRQYCETAEPLPLVLDDVLVNFDDRRAQQTLEALIELSATNQIIFLTCHQRFVRLVEQRPDCSIIRLQQNDEPERAIISDSSVDYSTSP